MSKFLTSTLSTEGAKGIVQIGTSCIYAYVSFILEKKRLYKYSKVAIVIVLCMSLMD